MRVPTTCNIDLLVTRPSYSTRLTPVLRGVARVPLSVRWPLLALPYCSFLGRMAVLPRPT